MREFRGKRKDNGEWVYGSLSVTIEGCLIHSDENKNLLNYIKVLPETVGQFTGLKDKNGKDLDWWEGDVYDLFGPDTPHVIVRDKGCFWFEHLRTKCRYPCYDHIFFVDDMPKIGNIHDNPELLEGRGK